MRNILFSFFAVCASMAVYSQNIPPINMSNINLNPELVKSYVDNFRNNVLNYSSVSDKNENVIGSPYSDEKFRKATVNDSPFQFDLRYNIYSDKLEFMKEDQVYDLESPDNLTFTFPETKKSIKKLKYNIDGKNIDGYLYVLKEGQKFILYKKENVLLKYDEGATNSYVNHSKIRFNTQKPTYILFYNNEYQVLPKNRKDLVKMFKNNSTLDTFLKTSDNKFKTDDDFIQIADYLDRNN